VAVELEFLYLLTFRQHQAQVTGDATAAASWDDLRQRFVQRHLGAWVGPFTDAVRAGARTAFYRELAGLTDRFIRR
jgi:TorA maturation chaperone TorD